MYLGPDRPVVTAEPMVVSEFNHLVRISCRVQPDGFVVGDTTIEWQDSQVFAVHALIIRYLQALIKPHFILRPSLTLYT